MYSNKKMYIYQKKKKKKKKVVQREEYLEHTATTELIKFLKIPSWKTTVLTLVLEQIDEGLRSQCPAFRFLLTDTWMANWLKQKSTYYYM